MDLKLQLIVHGRGNAWPVFVGETHPYYDHRDPRELSSASYSLVFRMEDGTEGEVLIDAGHGTVQSLISGRNRIPDCICLTHGHLDHTLGVDWVVQSYHRTGRREKNYPLYATGPVLEGLVAAYPQLEGMIEKRELVPASPIRTEGPADLEVTAFPVYHGNGAFGASMLLFSAGGKRILFTGDLFCPLLREADYGLLQEPDLLVVDTNNRFPWPRANHWSFAGSPKDPAQRSEVLNRFLDDLQWDTVADPHRLQGAGKRSAGYFGELREEWDTGKIPCTIMEFIRKVRPGMVMPVHYSGTEDEKHYGEPRMSQKELGAWIGQTATEAGIESRFLIPSAGGVIDL